MRIISLIFVMFLTYTKVFSCDSNQCGTIAREPDRSDGTITYVRITIIGKRFVVTREEKDDVKCFSGYEDDICGYRRPKKLGNNASKKIWYEIHNDYKDLMKIQESAKNYLKNK